MCNQHSKKIHPEAVTPPVKPWHNGKVVRTALSAKKVKKEEGSGPLLQCCRAFIIPQSMATRHITFYRGYGVYTARVMEVL